jgi:TrmH family RNA methyltransferase
MTVITSLANPRVGKVQDLHTPRGRKKHGLFIMEGPHLLEELLDADVLPQEVYYQPEMLRHTEKGRALLERLLHTNGLTQQHLVEVSERVIEALGDVQTSQGLVSVLPLEALQAERVAMRREVRQRPALLILDDLADPGNMGMILRTALAADVALVLLTPNCVDYFSPKVVRAAAGAHVALPVEVALAWSAIEERVMAHCENMARVLLAEAGSPHMYYEEDLRRPFALIIGNEAHGPSETAHRLATRTITIPLSNKVESLNAAMATGIVLYEAVRQARSSS